MSQTDGDLLRVIPDVDQPSMGWAHLGDGRWRCALGRSGVADNKVEGDGLTPAGEYPLRRLLYRADRLALPRTGLRGRPIGPHDGWCDDPESPSYNRWVRIPNEWRCEQLWREDGLYDLVVPIGYNDDPPEGEWGSAIFLHIAKDDYSPTQGCVAFKREDLLELVTLIGPGTKINVHSIPANETAPKASGDEDMKQFEDFDEQDW